MSEKEKKEKFLIVYRKNGGEIFRIDSAPEKYNKEELCEKAAVYNSNIQENHAEIIRIEPGGVIDYLIKEKESYCVNINSELLSALYTAENLSKMLENIYDLAR